MAIDLRPPFSGKAVWKFVVETDIPNTDIAITWPNLKAIPKNLSLILVDEQTDQKHYMRTSSAYIFKSGPNGAKRNFRIEVGPGLVSPLKITNIIALPDKSGGFSISYSLSKPAACDIKIYNLTGKLIRILIAAMPKSAGLNHIYWDARNTAGLPVPNGVYILQIIATTEEYQSAKAVRPIMVSK